MECKIRIRDIAVYHPSKAVDNEFFFKHFEKQGKDVKHFLEDILGRKSRYMIDNKGKKESERENSLTMQIEAAKRVLKKTNLTGKDIDGIIVATQFPEYMVPPSFMSVHVAIDGKRECFGYDMNCNCLGMTMALQQAGYYFECNKKLQKMLIVGGDYLSLGVCESDDNFYGAFGDSACAIIVERTNDESRIVDCDYFINNESINMTRFPNCGLSLMVENQDKNYMSMQFKSPNCEIDVVVQKIKDMLTRNHLTVDDVKGYCLSQYVQYNNKKIMEYLGINEEKCPYVGNEFGYTGVNSPFLVLHRLIEEKKINRGDYILFWTIGTGLQHIFLIVRY